MGMSDAGKRYSETKKRKSNAGNRMSVVSSPRAHGAPCRRGGSSAWPRRYSALSPSRARSIRLRDNGHRAGRSAYRVRRRAQGPWDSPATFAENVGQIAQRQIVALSGGALVPEDSLVDVLADQDAVLKNIA